MTPLFFNPKRLNSTQLIKNNVGRRQYDRNWSETRSNPKQRAHKIKRKIQEIKGYNLINGAKIWYRMMRTSWSRNPHEKTPILEKQSKSGLIRVWHKYNLYLGTRNIGNTNPHLTNINSWSRSITMTPRSQLLFDKLFFTSLKNQKMRQIRCFINLNCLTYMSCYAFIYTDSRLKQTLMDLLCGVIWCSLTIKPK